MVTTRTKTGALNPQKYDALTLQLNSIILSPSTLTSPPSSPSKPRHSTSTSTQKTRRKSSVRRHRITKLSSQRVPKPAPLTAEDQAHVFSDFISKPPLEALKPSRDLLDGHYGPFPARGWGEKEVVGLSKIGRAEKEVQIWEAVLEAHKADTIPDLVPVCEAKLQAAKERRAKLEDCEENHRVGIPQAYPGEIAIAQRIEGLEWGLSTCKFVSEEENIRAAIRGYRSGEIGFNEHYTLIYAGKIVDTATSYKEFVNNRSERLDRYAEAHGHHWLWYEPPLNVHPETMPTAMASCALPREDGWTSLGPYHVNQGFWKREGLVARMPALRFAAPPPEMFLIDPQGRVDAGNPGPKLTFRSLLDSGATFPSLHTEDLVNLGIDASFYSAQSVQRMSTANGIIHSRIYEMLVCVLDDAGKHLVDPNNAMWPDFQKYLGGLCPVMESANPLMYDQNGIEVPNRLSGLLPFLACYISSTPTRNMLFLGEDRNDVLGGHRMPGQRKWDIAMPNGPPAAVGQWNRYDDPKITFNHRQGAIMDEDDPDPNVKFRSIITVMRGHPNEREEIVDSRRDTQLLRQAFINANDPWAHLRAGGAVWSRDDFLKLLDHAQRDTSWNPLAPGNNPFLPGT